MKSSVFIRTSIVFLYFSRKCQAEYFVEKQHSSVLDFTNCNTLQISVCLYNKVSRLRELDYLKIQVRSRMLSWHVSAVAMASSEAFIE